MRIRAHRGGLDESMATVAEIEPTAQAVADHITTAWKLLLGPGKTITPEIVKVGKYGDGIDTRIGWDTYIITVDGHGVFGMTDGPLREAKHEVS